MKTNIVLFVMLLLVSHSVVAQTSWETTGNILNGGEFLGTQAGSPDPNIGIQTNGIPHSFFFEDGSLTVNGNDGLDPKINIGMNTPTPNANSRLSISQGWNDWVRFYNPDLQKYWSFHNPQGLNELVIGRIDVNNPSAPNPFPYSFTEDRGLTIRQDWGDWLQFHKTANSGFFGLHNAQSQTGMQFYFKNQWGAMTWNILNLGEDGKVSIGDGIPSLPGNYKLYVKDGILTEKVKVALTNTSQWSDYVFESDYDLMPLAEVNEFITNYKHLPNVPSAEEVVEEGLDLGKMDAKLLEKIEELTLYLIQQNKNIELLQKKLAALENKNQ